MESCEDGVSLFFFFYEEEGGRRGDGMAGVQSCVLLYCADDVRVFFFLGGVLSFCWVLLVGIVSIWLANGK